MGSSHFTARRAVAAAAVAAVGFSALAGGAASAENTTYRTANGPENCVIFDAQGNVIPPKPGDCAQFGKAGQGRSNAKARNVILIIGDGMGQSEITAARNYLKGASGRFEGIDELTSEGMYTHHSVNKNGSFNYVTDSAASGTAWATGTKTYNGAIGVDLAGKPVQNLIEQAKNAGLRTGNVTTSDIQDATPAVMGAHSTSRSYYAPSGKSKPAKGADLRENGGLGSISEQIVDTRADVTLGGGAKYFDAMVTTASGNTNPFLEGAAKYNTRWEANKSVLENARANDFQVVTTADELAGITKANQDSPVLGLFAPSNMTTAYKSSRAKVGGAKADPLTCEKQDIGTQPELVDMTRKAIELLDDPSAEKGFFLQIESASIDKRDHASDACGQIGETDRLDQATKVALDFAKKDGQTLVVVTADHSHTAQIVSDGDDHVGPVTRLATADGSPMSILYGTTKVAEDGTNAGSQQHTGAQLRVAAYGPGEENVLGQTDQTDLFYTIGNALSLNAEASTAASDAKLAKPVAGGSKMAIAVDENDKVTVPAPGDFAQYGKDGEQRSDAKAKNVVLFIGDGMGDSEITSARNYLYGANGRLPGIDNLEYTGSYTHFSIDRDGAINYVTDSAASGTAWATGTKTYNGAIGVDLAQKPQENLLEKAKRAGLKTGNITTSEVQDATPAVMGAHVTSRSHYAPSGNAKPAKGSDLRENGGMGSISEQLVDTRAHVTMAGGAKYFDAEVQVSGTWGETTRWTAGKSVLENARDNDFQIVTTAEQMAALTEANQDKPVLGLFTPGNMPRMFNESVPTPGKPENYETCTINPKRTADVPTLAAMTQKSMDLLKNDAGFFLQVEAASIDKADHGADACGQIGELDDLDQAVAVAQRWAKENGEPTLILVTADHAHTSQIVGVGSTTSGVNTILKTVDGDYMQMSYNTAASNEVARGGQGHTGAQLRIAASGPGAENVIGRTDQTDLHYTVANALGLDKESQPVVNQFVKEGAKPDPSAEPSVDPSADPSVNPTPEPGKDPSGDPTADPSTPATPSDNGNTFYVSNNWTATVAQAVFSFGRAGDDVLVGDWNGDGKDSFAVRRGNTFYVSDTLAGGKAPIEFSYGKAGDTVLVGDWDGDGKDTFAVQRGNTFYVANSLKSGDADEVISYGRYGDTPLVGDWDGDGKDTFAVRRGNVIFVKNAIVSGNADTEFSYGKAKDEIFTGDFDGNGTDTFAVRRGNALLVKNSLNAGPADLTLHYGRVADELFVGDWDGNGTDTPAVRR